MKIILRLGEKKYSIISPVKSPWTRRTWCGGSTNEECVTDPLLHPSHRPVSRDGRPLPPGLDVIGCGLACAQRTASAATRSRNDRVTWKALSQLARPWPEKRTNNYGVTSRSDTENHLRGGGAEQAVSISGCKKEFAPKRSVLNVHKPNKICHYSPQVNICWIFFEILKYYGKQYQ